MVKWNKKQPKTQRFVLQNILWVLSDEEQCRQETHPSTVEVPVEPSDGNRLVRIKSLLAAN